LFVCYTRLRRRPLAASRGFISDEWDDTDLSWSMKRGLETIFRNVMSGIGQSESRILAKTSIRSKYGTRQRDQVRKRVTLAKVSKLGEKHGP